MKRHVVSVLVASALVACASPSSTSSSSSSSSSSSARIVVDPLSARPATKGPADRFTGDVTIQPWFSPQPDRELFGALVTFQPGARTAWHTHPKGQTLIVTDGTGWIQDRGGARRDIKAGDVVWTAPGVEHWHGGTDAAAMAHIALVETVDGRSADWHALVSDTEAGIP